MPNEGSYTGRSVYRAAHLFQVMDYLGRCNYAKALASVKASGEWLENLGVGKPYDELIDTRLRLRRLAVRLRLSWTYMVGNYRLHQLILHSIPLRYQVVPVPDVATGNTYPSLLSLFTTLVENESIRKVPTVVGCRPMSGERERRLLRRNTAPSKQHSWAVRMPRLSP